jgi:alpha-methylacyl-CoA racemase
MGPLKGLRVVEMAGIGPVPYGCMMLGDMGADVVRVDRLVEGESKPDTSPLLRNRRSVAVDMKQKSAQEFVLSLVEKADVFVEGFRPGVAERLGIGPDACLARNPKLVYARMTGWGQDGPLAQAAGHDLNYIGLTGVLHQIGPTDGKPVVPLNLIGDFGGGGLLMAFGIMCAVFEARQSGKGQVIDAAMVDGALSFMAMFFGYRARGQFEDRTGRHLLGGGAHYYDVYECADGKCLSVGALEPQFYAAMIDKLGLPREKWLPVGYPKYSQEIVDKIWPEFKAELAAVFKTKTRDEWMKIFEGVDACVTPVLSLAEAAEHPHNRARNSFIEVGGVLQNAPAPRFSRTVPDHPKAPPRVGGDTDAVVADWGVDADVVKKAREANALR